MSASESSYIKQHNRQHCVQSRVGTNCQYAWHARHHRNGCKGGWLPPWLHHQRGACCCCFASAAVEERSSSHPNQIATESQGIDTTLPHTRSFLQRSLTLKSWVCERHKDQAKLKWERAAKPSGIPHLNSGQRSNARGSRHAAKLSLRTRVRRGNLHTLICCCYAAVELSAVCCLLHIV